MALAGGLTAGSSRNPSAQSGACHFACGTAGVRWTGTLWKQLAVDGSTKFLTKRELINMVKISSRRQYADILFGKRDRSIKRSILLIFRGLVYSEQFSYKRSKLLILVR